ncbi:MAG: glycosyltransferase family 39 protein [Alphaproteobacteria bacterium]|nr:glycosyltransferase family 39 protein [Alphaproteobacteria bacterium]MDE2112807.1 glycosyltransferase family 39 protein [Alphaproteobacteria bacterium]MDE2492641.1 glycosyltransferase family 39 protein [Alphaproteobacteria bacterium]
MTDAVAGEALGRLTALLSRLARRPRLVLLLLCLALWTPGLLTLPPLDRDESRFAQASKQMLETGNFVDIRFGAVPRYKKPVGIYWLQAAATAAVGQGRLDQIWTYRLPSLFGAILAVWLAFWCARAFMDAETAIFAAALLGTTLLLAVEATIATTDAVLLATVLAVQGVLMRVYLAARSGGSAAGSKLVLAGWAALGFGILVKGPVAPAVATLTIAGLSLWDRDWRWLKGIKPWAGLAIVAAIVAPWAIAIALRTHGHFYEQSLGHDFAAKLEGGQESHGQLPGYFLLLSTLTFWPAVLFLAPSAMTAIRRRGEPAMRFLAAWIVPWWVIVELVPTKLPHYILPVYPALAMLAAVWALEKRETQKAKKATALENAEEGGPPKPPVMEPLWDRALSYVAALQFVLGLAALTAAAIILPGRYGDGTTWWLATLACLFAALGLGALITFLRRANLAAAMLAFAAVLVFYPGLTAGVAPRLGQLWVSPRAAAAARSLAQPGDPPPALAGYTEPSLVFLLGTDTRLTNGRGAADAGAAEGGLALVEESERPAFLARLAELEADANEVGSVTGYNYSRGRRVHIRIYRVKAVLDEPPPPPE